VLLRGDLKDASGDVGKNVNKNEITSPRNPWDVRLKIVGKFSPYRWKFFIKSFINYSWGVY
jgi:hypothetical protein